MIGNPPIRSQFSDIRLDGRSLRFVQTYPEWANWTTQVTTQVNALQTPPASTLAAPTGTATYTTFNTATVTTAQLAERLMALHTLLAAKGII